MKQEIRLFIGFEAATFILAAIIHAGALITGYAHQKACIAESVIASVLIIGLLASLVRPRWTKIAGLWVQEFAFLGTCVGVFTILVGIGPQTVPDIGYHAFILMVLGRGIATAKRSQRYRI